MTLKEKLCEPFGGLRHETLNELEKIADNFAIDFAEWCMDYFTKEIVITSKELLEIYKKEKGL